MNEEKTKGQIIQEEFERAERSGERVNSLKDLVVFMHEEIEYCHKKINLLDGELDDLSKGLKKENDELTEKVQELEAELAEAGTVIENKARSEKRLNDAIIANNIEIEELKINNRDLQEKIRDEQELSERCRIEKDAALRSNSDLVQKVRDLEEDLATAKEQIEEKERRIKWLETQNMLWRKETEKQTERAERAEKEIRETKTIGEIEHGTFYPDDETVITINRKPDEILSVSVLFANEREEEEDDGEN